jgi:hypothetical protein
MVLGMAFLRLAHGMQPLIWTAFWALTAVHVWANVKAMRCLRISSLNQARTQLLLRHYLRTVRGSPGVASSQGCFGVMPVEVTCSVVLAT